MRGSVIAAIAALALSACGASQTTLESPSTSPLTTIPPGASTHSAVSDESDLSAYLVEMSNLEADLDNRLGEFEQIYNQAFFGEIGDEPGEDEPPPPPPSEEELFDYHSGYFHGFFDLIGPHVDRLGAVTVPGEFKGLHDDYVSAYRSWHEAHVGLISWFTTAAEFNDFMAALFSATGLGIPPELKTRHDELRETCVAIEDRASELGFSAQLGCPPPPAEPIEVAVDVGESWSADPNPLPVTFEGPVQMTITNTGSRPIRPVVLVVLEGDPLGLPLVDGLVDLSPIEFEDAQPGETLFHLGYVDQAAFGVDGEIGEVPELAPGASIVAEIWDENTLVVIDQTPGVFAAGGYLVIERS